MRGSPGTPGFIGTRLKEAREARSLTMVALADLLSVSKQAVSQYEKDHQSPAPDVFDKLCKVLNLPPHYFCRNAHRRDLGALFFRSFSKATKTARTRAARRFEWLEDVVSHVQSFVRFAEPDFPDFDIPDDPSLIKNKNIEELATLTRRHWGLRDGPISNVVWLLENKGGIVVRQMLDSEDLDAYSNWNPEIGRPLFILGADKASAVRSRFDAAHELAHMVLHRKVTATMMNKKEIFSLVENQAFRFASAFLMPATSFATELSNPSLEAMKVLKSKWRVSIGAMVMRATDLGLISEYESRRMWISISRRGWRLSEPLDDTLEMEVPQFMRRCIDLLFEKGIASRSDFSNQLSLSDSDMEGILGLPLGYIQQQQDALPIFLKMPESKTERTRPVRDVGDEPSVRFRRNTDFQ